MASRKVLIIDDDDDVRDSLQALLRSEGFEADSAKSGPDALTLLSQASPLPGAILLDMLMPSMSGDQFRLLLQRHPEWSRIPIIVSTAGSVPAQVMAGVFAVLRKPFDFEHLLELLTRACDSAP